MKLSAVHLMRHKRLYSEYCRVLVVVCRELYSSVIVKRLVNLFKDKILFFTLATEVDTIMINLI